MRRKLKEKLAEHRRQDRLDRKRGDRTGPDRAQEKARRRASLEKLRKRESRAVSV